MMPKGVHFVRCVRDNQANRYVSYVYWFGLVEYMHKQVATGGRCIPPTSFITDAGYLWVQVKNIYIQINTRTIFWNDVSDVEYYVFIRTGHFT